MAQGRSNSQQKRCFPSLGRSHYYEKNFVRLRPNGSPYHCQQIIFEFLGKMCKKQIHSPVTRAC